MCGLVCPSRTSEREGKGNCVKEGGGEEGECVKGRAGGRGRGRPRFFYNTAMLRKPRPEDVSPLPSEDYNNFQVRTCSMTELLLRKFSILYS